jgi:endonuclease/exonuclease/phosphatase family metal-dependent hydrolase
MDSVHDFSIDNFSNDPKYDFLNSLFSNDEPNPYDYSESPYDVCNISSIYTTEYEFIKLKNVKNQASVMSFNIQSISAKFNEFFNFVALLQSINCAPDVICLQELWQFPNDVNFSLPGYHSLVYELRKGGVQGGGVGIYIKDVYNFSVLNNLSVFHDRLFESIFCEVSLNPNKKFIVGSIYRPTKTIYNLSPSEQFQQFCDILLNINNEIQKTNSIAYLMEDFNVDVLKYKNCNFASSLIDLFFSLGHIQVVSKPTRCTDYSATLIDHIYTNNVHLNEISSFIIISHLSDHFPVITKLNEQCKPSHPKFIERRVFSQNNVINFSNSLLEQDWTHVIDCNDTQIAYNLFSDTFFNIFNTSFPLTRAKFNRNIHAVEKWMSKGLLISRCTKISLGKDYAKNPSPAIRMIFSNYRNIYNRTVRAAKKMYYEKQFMLNQSNVKKTWDLIFEVIKKKQGQKQGIIHYLS